MLTKVESVVIVLVVLGLFLSLVALSFYWKRKKSRRRKFREAESLSLMAGLSYSLPINIERVPSLIACDRCKNFISRLESDVRLPCSHVFHRTCIRSNFRWCPKCLAVVSDENKRLLIRQHGSFASSCMHCDNGSRGKPHSRCFFCQRPAPVYS